MSETEIKYHHLNENQKCVITEVLRDFADRVESVTVTSIFGASTITETVKLRPSTPQEDQTSNSSGHG